MKRRRSFHWNQSGIAAGVVAVFLLAAVAGCGHKASESKQAAIPGSKQRIAELKSKRQEALLKVTGISRDTLKAKIYAEKKKQQQAGKKKHVQEALQSIQETENAIDLIKKGKTQAAMDTLAKTVGKLELLLTRYPSDSLILADSYEQTINLATNLKSAKWAHEQVKKWVAQDELQNARRLLDNMVSEIRITSVYLPIKTYPAAIKKAAKLLDEGKTKDAQAVLEEALTTLVIEERSIPIPIISAIALTDAASVMADSSKDKAVELLKNARVQLELAKELGYHPHDKIYKVLDKEIKSLMSSLKKGKKTKGVFQDLHKKLRKFKEKF
ncbi:MAG: YfdX family protein [Calditrichaeota bacterium]|nr:YfdX family protein [Calditrichota bacterium]